MISVFRKMRAKLLVFKISKNILVGPHWQWLGVSLNKKDFLKTNNNTNLNTYITSFKQMYDPSTSQNYLCEFLT